MTMQTGFCHCKRDIILYNKSTCGVDLQYEQALRYLRTFERCIHCLKKAMDLKWAWLT